jgi:hypothetical protein
VGSLYAEGASFRSHPFRELQDPREYAAWAFASEDEPLEIRFSEPIVAAGDRAVVEWWAHVRADGEEQTLVGVSILRLRDDGLVVDQRDYWAEGRGRREASPDFGT